MGKRGRCKGLPQFIGIGREVAPTLPAMTVEYWPFIPFGSDSCERCEAVRPVGELETFAYDVDGEPHLRCAGGCA